MKKHLFFVNLALSLFASDYETHLPAEIYTDLAELIDETIPANSLAVEGEQGTAQLDVAVKDESVTILYVPAAVEDNFGGMQVGFQNGEMVGYALFDAEGRDFVATPPAFTEEEQKEMTTFITDTVLPIFEEEKVSE